MLVSAIVSAVEKRTGSFCAPNVEMLCWQIINFNPPCWIFAETLEIHKNERISYVQLLKLTVADWFCFSWVRA